jgi:hypothetical protein
MTIRYTALAEIERELEVASMTREIFSLDHLADSDRRPTHTDVTLTIRYT